MTADLWLIPIPEHERAEAWAYADASLPHTQRKLEQQQSVYAPNANRARIASFRAARSAVARSLREHGVPCQCDESSHRDKAQYCIRARSGHLVQVRFITDRPNYRKLLEEVWSFEKRPHDFYVATTSRDDLETLVVLGYATRAEMQGRRPVSHGQGRASYYVYLTDLRPFRELAELLQSVCRTQRAPLTGQVGRRRSAAVSRA
jgi:hypothetical protein